MDISISNALTDATHVFGIASSRRDRLDAKAGIASGPIHREGMTRQEAIDWLQTWIDTGGREDAFFVMAFPKAFWSIAEIGRSFPLAPKHWD